MERMKAERIAPTVPVAEQVKPVRVVRRPQAESNDARIDGLSAFLKQRCGENYALLLYWNEDDKQFTIFDEMHGMEIRERHLGSLLTRLARVMRNPPWEQEKSHVG